MAMHNANSKKAWEAKKNKVVCAITDTQQTP